MKSPAEVPVISLEVTALEKLTDELKAPIQERRPLASPTPTETLVL